jgi:hypothetical protein
VQFDVAGNVRFLGDSTESGGEFDRVVCSDALVSVTGDYPDGTTGKFLRLLNQT